MSKIHNPNLSLDNLTINFDFVSDFCFDSFNPIRLAAMLNYFLKTLTGPEQKKFKVSDLDKYSFKPGEVVQKISQIYINLIDCDTFIRAISSDGRSYSTDLFTR